jgi:hypothetical protein
MGTKPNAHVALGKITLKQRVGPITDRRIKAHIRVTAWLMGIPGSRDLVAAVERVRG